MQAYVYKSLRKADTYVYLGARDDFARLPDPVRSQLGSLQFVLELALTPERKLAREDVAVVRENIVARGFHLQFPPAVEEPAVDKLKTFGVKEEDWGTDA
ncbi:YcgL domain-containing protein [Lysobacter terrae]